MNRFKQLIEWVRHYPLGLAIAASLVLHAGTLVAAHFFLQETAPRPLAIQTVALVVIEQPSPRPDAPPKATPETVAPMAPAPAPKALSVKMPPLRKTKPITPDPRSAALPVPPPLFKAPPRRPILSQPALTTPDPVPTPSTPPHVAKKPVKTTKTAPTNAHKPPLTPPRYGIKGLTNPHPRYPWLARQRGEHGRVVVRVAVDRSGQVINAEIARSSGYGRLDRSALSTLRRWRFVPARRGTAPVTATVEVPVTFRLSDN